MSTWTVIHITKTSNHDKNHQPNPMYTALLQIVMREGALSRCTRSRQDLFSHSKLYETENTAIESCLGSSLSKVCTYLSLRKVEVRVESRK